VISELGRWRAFKETKPLELGGIGFGGWAAAIIALLAIRRGEKALRQGSKSGLLSANPGPHLHLTTPGKAKKKHARQGACWQ